jgi:hypothetical protein
MGLGSYIGVLGESSPVEPNSCAQFNNIKTIIMQLVAFYVVAAI